MSIRKRIEEARALQAAGYHEAALILASVAVAGASRLTYPRTDIPGDGQAFKTYLDRRILETTTHGPITPGGAFLVLSYKGKEQSIAAILYHEYRCNLVHEAELPSGVSIGGEDRGLSFTVADDILVLTEGWIRLLIDVVINDPALRDTFDDIRRRHPDDLTYVGGIAEEHYANEFVDEFYSSAGRLSIIKTFVATVGAEGLAQLDDSEIQELWDEEVLKDPGRFGLSESCLTGLSFPGPQVQGPDVEGRAFLYRAGKSGSARISDAGIKMLRSVSNHYR
ncbi:hypothetical protein [Qipengyuania sediminis]|uniref:hypothetical protein n=1 Tax=Qipengyuania sediminis TaxID=1532023 RepID=UPI00105963B4|nr:hypothetical protein [Qipengyuania sediminis]